MSENGEIYTAGKNFTLLLAVTAWTNLTSAPSRLIHHALMSDDGGADDVHDDYA